MERVKGPDMDKDAAITRLVEQYQRDLLKISYIYLRDAALAEDAVQETFLKAYRALDEFRKESSEKTWLMRIAINTCKDMRKSAWFRLLDRRRTPEELPEASREDGDGALMGEVLALPPKWKEAVLLYYYEQMNERDIAASLGVGVSTVSARLSKARKKLRIALEGGKEDEG